MGELIKSIELWSQMTYDENPYGDPIPAKYLNSPLIMRDGCQPLSGRKQDGCVLDYIFNDMSKESAAEKEETVPFSAVFHRLEQAGTLCPSNYVAEVIKALEQWDAANNTRHDDDFYCKTIARALRTFASFLREEDLREIITQYLKIEAIRRRQGFKMFEPSVEEDMQQKTDIMLKYAGAFYRVWSYQSTKSGINKTSARIKRGAGRGRNLLIPFDIGSVEKTYGWALYDKQSVQDTLRELVVTHRGPIQSYYKYKAMVEEDPSIIATPALFDKA